MKKTNQKELPMNVFVEPKDVLTNMIFCEAITDSGGTPGVEKIKYGKRIIPTLEMTTDLLKKAYNSAISLNNQLKFNVYAKINDNFQRFKILEPFSQKKAKNERPKVVKKLRKIKSFVQENPN